MKVVQKGSLTKRVTCKRCKTELEYEPEDVKSTTYTCPKLGQSYAFVQVRNPSRTE
jgi:PHP family Zn ribbon phosphoesterase